MGRLGIRSAVIATAEFIRHLIAVPYVLLGIAFILWARPVARFFGSAHRWLYRSEGSGGWVYKGFGGWLSDERVGPWFIRVFGVVFLAISLYWAIVGTG